MNTIDFCYWLQGYFELSDAADLTERQVAQIKEHLHLVFLHEIDPLRNSQTTTPIEALNEAHKPSGTMLFPTNDPLVRC